jgi:hypothetical protein
MAAVMLQSSIMHRMTRRLAQVIVILSAVSVIASCAPHYPGIKGETCSYIGSDAHTDYFIYNIYTPNSKERSIHQHVRFSRNTVHLGFERRPYRLPDGGISVVPEFQGGRVTGFLIDTNGAGLR